MLQLLQKHSRVCHQFAKHHDCLKYHRNIVEYVQRWLRHTKYCRMKNASWNTIVMVPKQKDKAHLDKVFHGIHTGMKANLHLMIFSICSSMEVYTVMSFPSIAIVIAISHNVYVLSGGRRRRRPQQHTHTHRHKYLSLRPVPSVSPCDSVGFVFDVFRSSFRRQTIPVSCRAHLLS